MSDSNPPNRSPPARMAAAFYRDRRLMGLALLLIAVAGGSSLLMLPRMEDPVLAKRVAIVNTMMPGADAARMESLVTEKIEDELRDIDEIKELRSVSRVGIATVSIELRDDVFETDRVWSRVRSRIEDSIANLPPEASRPVLEELEVRAYALIVGVRSTTPVAADRRPQNLRLLRRMAIELQDRLQNLSGTEKVERFADPGEEITVKIDPTRAAGLGLTPASISGAIVGYDARSAAGRLQTDGARVAVAIDNQLHRVETLGDIPLRSGDGRDIRLRDVAAVDADVPDPLPVAAILDGHPAVVLGVMVRQQTRVDRWTRRAEQLIADFETELPRGVTTTQILRQDDYVAARLRNLAGNLILGAAAVAVVTFLIMGFRAAWIVTATLPLVSLMVLFGLRLMNIPIHQMSVTGLIIALGLMIDNAIVVVDEVRGRLRRGDAPETAMSGSVAHLAVPLLGSTLTTALAFAPIALMPGPAGEFVGSIAISVIMAIVSSLLLALTITPTLAAMASGRRDDQKSEATLSADSTLSAGSTMAGGVGRTWWRRGMSVAAAWFDGGVTIGPLTRWYRGVIVMLTGRPVLGMVVGMIFPVIGFVGFGALKEQFFPPSGRDQFHITIEATPTATLAQTRRIAESVESIARRFEPQSVHWFFGESAPSFYYNVIANRRGTQNFGQAVVRLGDDRDPIAVIAALQRMVDAEIPSARVIVRQLEQGPPFEAPIEVRLFGPDLTVLRRLGDDVRARLQMMPEVTTVRADLAEVLPQLRFRVRPAVASTLGVTPASVSRQLQTTLDGARGGFVLEDNEQLPVSVRVDGADRGDVSRVQSMEMVIDAADGAVVTTPLSAIATTDLVPQSAAIPRFGRVRMNEVLGYVRAGVLPSIVQTKIEQSLQTRPLNLPDGYRLEFGGEASKRDDAVGNLLSTVGVLGVLMTATLVLSCGGFKNAGIIGMVAILSVGLAMAALRWFEYPFGFMAIIGTMGLIGVAINDSIVVMASIAGNPDAAAGNVDAIADEVTHATRHVLATTLTTMVGFAPLVIDGGLFWPPMAVCIAGGVAGATLLALVFVPAAHKIAAR